LPPKKAIPIKKTRNKVDLRMEALNRLKQGYESAHEGEVLNLEGQPIVTPILKSAEGGLPRILEALRAHDDPDAKSFILLYDSLTGNDRNHLTLEEIAVAAGIGSLRLAEVATSAMILYGQMEAKLLIASTMGKVTKSIVKAAVDEVPITAYNMQTGNNEVVGRTNGDVKAMELFGKMSGLVPIPKGATIAIQTNLSSDRSLPPQENEPIYLDPGQRLRMIHEAVGQRRLPAPPSESIAVGGRLERLQHETAVILDEVSDVI